MVMRWKDVDKNSDDSGGYEFIDKNGAEYKCVNYRSKAYKNPREGALDAVDQLMKEEKVQEIMEHEIEDCKIPFEQETPFRDGFRIGMAFMLWLHAENKLKVAVAKQSRDDVQESVGLYRKGKRRKGYKAFLAKMFGITPSDCCRPK